MDISNEDRIKFAKKGFIISFVTNTPLEKGVDEEVYEAQRIDVPVEWVEELGFIPPQLKSDDEAKKLAIEEGFEFNDANNPYRVTGRK